MTTASTIIKDALRESNLVAISATPTALETVEALSLLNRYIRWLFIRQKLPVVDYGIANVDTPNYQFDKSAEIDAVYAPQNLRLNLNLSASKTVNLDPNPQDGARFAVVDTSSNLASYPLTLNGNGRTIEGGTSATLNTNGLIREWFYRSDTGNWAAMTTLVAADGSPFPEEFDDLLVIGLAMRLNPRNGVQIDPQSIQTYKDNLVSFRARYFQNKEMASEEGLLRLSSSRYWRTYFGSDRNFDRGFNG